MPVIALDKQCGKAKDRIFRQRVRQMRDATGLANISVSKDSAVVFCSLGFKS